MRIVHFTSLLLFSATLPAQVFYPDDPLWQEPPPISVGKVAPQHLDNFVDFYKNTFKKKGERNTRGNVIPSIGVNTLGEVPDSAWYTNRPLMSPEEYAKGPDRAGPPSAKGQWTVTAVKAEGVTPGFTIQDEQRHKYLLKFDPLSNPELATAADSVGSKFFYALGYNVPENYPVRFRREQLTIGVDVKFKDAFGKERLLKNDDLEALLKLVPRYKDGTYRGLASFFLSGDLIGPYKYYKRRPDDPNELGPHEHLRSLRGLYVFAAWLNHTDAKSINSLDAVVEENGRRFVKHYLIDFGAALGSDSLYAKDPRLGHEYFFAAKPGLVQLATLGLDVPRYARVSYPRDPAVGNFDVESFDPEHWHSNYPNAAFENRTVGDEFWAAKKVMAVRDDAIRAMVKTGDYSRPESAETISQILIKRRDKIGRAFFAKVLPLDDFRVENGQLAFTDLAVKYGFQAAASYRFEWAEHANREGVADQFTSGSAAVPNAAANGTYRAARITDPARANRGVTVYLRRDADTWKVVGAHRDHENDWSPL